MYFEKQIALLCLDTCACRLSNNLFSCIKKSLVYQQIFSVSKIRWQITIGYNRKIMEIVNQMPIATYLSYVEKW
jgi:hypothetical protein